MCYSVLLKAFTFLLMKRSEAQKAFIYNIYQIEKDVIAAINQNRRKIFEKFSLGDIEQKYLDLIGQIYNSQNLVEISIHHSPLSHLQHNSPLIYLISHNKGKWAYELYSRLR